MESKIGWWRGENSLPTNHMLSLQGSCVNHLFWLMKNKDATTEVLKGIDLEFKAISFPKKMVLMKKITLNLNTMDSN